jgi:hypothetical protein
MNRVAEELRAALVDVFPAHVEARLRYLRVDEDLSDPVADGCAWLESELGELLELPFDQQRRGPLQVFQEAMRFPTAVLRAHGVAPVDRDEVAERNLPWDLYDLAPASSSPLGEDVWRAHLAWGAAKAHAMTGGDR